MLLSKYSYTKISSSNVNHWRSLGYDVRGGGRAGKNNGQRIKVLTSQLKPQSNIAVACRCDRCGKKYVTRYRGMKDYCWICHRHVVAVGNTHGKALKGRTQPKLRGELHGRFNPNKRAFQTYANQVRWLTKKTYDAHKAIINPLDLPRTRCGVAGGYQLDHKVSVKEAFAQGWPAAQTAALDNLEMLPWRSNRSKGG